MWMSAVPTHDDGQPMHKSDGQFCVSEPQPKGLSVMILQLKKMQKQKLSE
jgi:hypothetical protein